MTCLATRYCTWWASLVAVAVSSLNNRKVTSGKVLQFLEAAVQQPRHKESVINCAQKEETNQYYSHNTITIAALNYKWWPSSTSGGPQVQVVALKYKWWPSSTSGGPQVQAVAVVVTWYSP
ncbi:hypothetical protein Vafri_19162 [Volvox africanus]|uniref:Secreted protein n=1 Tax=Volvox africanus TaxID=51714 RepID=A0A8J4FCJ8_9CHLO|nr:hypothetical protein Vafri_19162 [Volvox africanus]